MIHPTQTRTPVIATVWPLAGAAEAEAISRSCTIDSGAVTGIRVPLGAAMPEAEMATPGQVHVNADEKAAEEASRDSPTSNTTRQRSWLSSLEESLKDEMNMKVARERTVVLSKHYPKPVYGIDVEERDGDIVIKSIVPGSPADKGGVKVGEILRYIGRHKVGSTREEALKLMCDLPIGFRMNFELETPR